MSGPEPTEAALEFHPLTRERWSDFEELFGERGAYGGCWCMWWRLTRRAFEQQQGEGNRQAMKAIVESGQVPGLLAQGHIDTAQAALAEARAEAEAMGARRMLWQILATLAEIEAQRGQVAEAENLRAQAREVTAFIADHAGTPKLCASFLTRPDVRAVLEERVE